MSKLVLNDVADLTSPTTAQTVINNNSDSIVDAIENTLSRDGTSPNQMNSELDMNSNQILNLPNPATANSPLRLQDLEDFIGGGTISSLPIGGTTGQHLTKNSNTNYDVGWSSESTALVAGTNISITGTTPATIATVTSPSFTGVTVSGLTASQSVQTDGSKNLTSLANTGSGNNVLATSPTLVTPILGTPTSGTLTNCTGLPISTGVSGLASNVATFLATPSSANLIAAMTDETGTGANVFATSPTLVTPLLGTPTSGTLTNCTGLPISTGVSGLGTNVATFLATPSSANLASALTNETGTGAVVFGTSPTITTPDLVGTSTNNNANAGSVGEFISSNVGAGSAVSLTTATPANVTSISLTAGDWDVWGNVGFVPNAATTMSQLAGSINTTSATLPTAPGGGAYALYNQTFATGSTNLFPVGQVRISLASTTTVFLIAQSTFAVNTNTAFGFIGARRVR